MLKSLDHFLKSLEQWEYYGPSSFWFCSIGLYFSFSVGFCVLVPQQHTQSHEITQSHGIIKELRAGGNEDSASYVPFKPRPDPVNPGNQNKPKPLKSAPKQNNDPKPGIRLSPGGDPGNSGNNGNGPSSWEEDNVVPPKEK